MLVRRAMKRNKVVLNDLLGKLYTIDTSNKIPDNFKNPLVLIQTAQNQKQTNRGSLPNLLKLKIGAKVKLTVNTEKQDRLIKY